MLKLGIIGQPRSGKTTIYNAVAAASADVNAYMAPDEIRRTVVKVPDERLERLFDLFKPPKKVAAEVEYVDFPAMTGDAHEVASFPPALRELNALIMVLRAFGDNPSPVEDARKLCDELILADLAVLEKRMERLSKEITSGRTENQIEYDALVRCRQALEAEQPIRSLEFTPTELKAISGYGFVSGMPILAVVNSPDEGSDLDADAWADKLALGPKSAVRVVRGKLEGELSALSPEDQQVFMDDLGLSESALHGMIAASYKLLGLITFFTGGSEKDVRAWAVEEGAKAPQAAGVIHSDFERGFIRAEVVPVEELIRLGSMAEARKAGLAQLEGKEYVVRDGDYILFRFNV
ncbi:MAG: redox-regulated ATPase YchF [Candidatus Zixiibacteriota bacterium]